MIRKLLALFLVLAALTCTAWADDGDNPDDDDDCNGENPDPCKCEDPKPCNCPDENGNSSCSGPTCKAGKSNSSLGFRLNFGGVPFEDDLRNGVIVIHQETPTPTQFTPQVVRYASIFSSRIVSKKTDAATWEVTMMNPSSRRKTFQFASGQSVAYSTDRRLALRLLSSSRTPVIAGQGQAQPAYARLEYSEGGWTEFDFTTGKPLFHQTLNGRLTELSTLPETVVTRVVQQDGVIRQIKSASGLADIVSTADQKFEIRIYAPSQVGTYDTGLGLYSLSGSAFRVIRLENGSSSPTEYGNVKITELWGTQTEISTFVYNEALKQWDLTTGTSGMLRSELKSLAPGPGSNETTTTRILKDESGAVVSTRQIIHRAFPWGKSVVQDVREPATLNLATTMTYHETPGLPGYSQMRSREKPDGSWEYWTYDVENRVVDDIKPWKDYLYSEGPRVIVSNSYTSLDSLDIVSSLDTRPRTVTTSVITTPGGTPIITQRTWHIYKTDTNGVYTEIEERAATATAAFGASGNLRTTRVYYTTKTTESGYDALSAGRLAYVDRPDGTRIGYTYSRNTSDANAYFTITEVLATAATPLGVDGLSTRTEKIHDVRGNLVQTKSFIRSAATWYLTTTENRTIDNYGHHVATDLDGRQTYAASYDAHLLVSSTTEDGVTTTFTYDGLGALESETRKGVVASGSYAAQSDITTTYIRELGGLDCGCDGELITTISAGSLSLETKTKKDPVGRLTYQKDAAGLETTYEYPLGGRHTIRTDPDGSVFYDEYYIDGRHKQHSGYAGAGDYFDYGVNADGTVWTKVSKASPISARWEITTTNSLDQVIKQGKPAYDGGVIATNYAYNAQGKVSRQWQRHVAVGSIETPLLADRLWEYDVMGNIARIGLDVNSNGVLDLVSADRISDLVTTFAYHESSWWKTLKTKVYPTLNSSDGVQNSEVRHRLSGFTSTLAVEAVRLDADGSLTRKIRKFDFGAKLLTDTTEYADSALSATTISRNGLLASETSKTVSTPTVYTYDALGRRTSVKEPRHTQASVFTYSAATGQLASQADAAGNVTAYEYYPQGQPGAGKLKLITNALGDTQRFAYDLMGRVNRIWGTANYPQMRSYNPFGELVNLVTWQDIGNADLNAPTWSLPTTGTSGTIWFYQESTGLLTRKQHADGKGPDYTYDKFNRLRTREWVRTSGGSPLVTTYSYTSEAGELASVDYSDSTPDLTSTYDRIGRRLTNTDVAGTWTFAYDGVTRRILTETLPGAYFGDRVLTRVYQGNMDGRPTAYQLGASSDPDRDLAVSYSYDNVGRLDGVISQAGSYTYDYAANSDLIASLTSPVHVASTVYEAQRDTVDFVENKVGTTTVSKYDYTVNEIGQRTARAQSGSAFVQGSTDTFGYNAKGELNSLTNSALTARNQSFAYDHTGNRLSFTAGSTTTNYTSNPLNQYTQIFGLSNASPTYDFDGNQLTTGLGQAYVWDAENRLISIEPVIPAGGDKKVANVYDGQGRRIRRTLFTYTSGAWVLSTDEKYIYHDWNVVAKLLWNPSSSTFELNSTFTWGLDASRSLQGAGGIGGLLAVSEVSNSQSYHFTYDANGNVSELCDSAGGVAAHYEYDAFGGIALSSGAYATANEYRFSTKPLDAATGLYYYGFRYYSPVSGRWTSRDPIDENDQILLYSFVGNSCVGGYDYLGLACKDCAGEKSHCRNRAQLQYQAQNVILGVALTSGLIACGASTIFYPLCAGLVSATYAAGVALNLANLDEKYENCQRNFDACIAANAVNKPCPCPNH